MDNRFGRSIKILVVDDDDLNQQMMNILLSRQGCVVKAASNGQEALDMVMSEEFDLIFMDLRLPDMDGVEVSRRIREWEAGKTHFPIVALTANDIPGEAYEWLKAGVDDYIYKPYNLGQLSRIIMLYAEDREALPSNDVHDLPANPDQDDVLVFDPQRALLNFSNDPDAFHELLRDFMESLPQRIELMEEYQRAGNLEDLGRKAHDLKGVSANLGAMRLSKLAKQLEKYCREKQNRPAETAFLSIKENVLQLQSAIVDFLQS